MIIVALPSLCKHKVPQAHCSGDTSQARTRSVSEDDAPLSPEHCGFAPYPEDSLIFK